METSFGATAVTTLEAPDVAQALGQIIASIDLEFDVWYREKLQELHGVNLAGYEQFAQPIPLPPDQELLFEWTLIPATPRRSKSSCRIGQANGFVPSDDIK